MKAEGVHQVERPLAAAGLLNDEHCHRRLDQSTCAGASRRFAVHRPRPSSAPVPRRPTRSQKTRRSVQAESHNSPTGGQGRSFTYRLPVAGSGNIRPDRESHRSLPKGESPRSRALSGPLVPVVAQSL
jgi:hypothetical protein